MGAEANQIQTHAEETDGDSRPCVILERRRAKKTEAGKDAKRQPGRDEVKEEGLNIGKRVPLHAYCHRSQCAGTVLTLSNKGLYRKGSMRLRD